ncbi:MAG TPA: glycosyltransferase family 4 protein, partial [Thermoanaerobaculia bacterium]|nr:glycosyltransferase family 4 protein [Thermoanaerobaculia bacterium]
KPWAGLALTFELAGNACRHPSPLLAEGQERLLQPLLGREPRFRAALAAYRREHCGGRHRVTEDYVRRFAQTGPRVGVSVYSALERAPLPPLQGAKVGSGPVARTRHLGTPFRPAPGVNLFGFHRSPIGLGHLSRGLHTALAGTGLPVRPNVLGNVAMDADLGPGDFVRVYDHGLDTNLFVSYPHLHDLLLAALPEHVVRDRRNVVYLAWEQRDGSHYWPEVYAGFEQVWALSKFAAESLERSLERQVAIVPCVLDTAAFPPPAAKGEVGLDPARFTFLYIFDANSSIERKNPEAVIRAFAAAFSPGEPVQLVLRVANAWRPDHRERLRRLLRTAPRGLDLALVLEEMPHRDLLRLLSAADCYVSLHRAEGFGYTCAEAMAYGKPVIATGYSGNLQFMHRENSYLVDYEEREVGTADGPFQRGSVWAEPSAEHAAHLMRSVYRDPLAAAEVGRCGRCDVLRQLSVTAVGRIAADALGR